MRLPTNLLEYSVIGGGAAIVLAALAGAFEAERAAANEGETAKQGELAPEEPNQFDGKPYKIYADGKVDDATWLGSRLYGNICFHCHGNKGVGSSFAPSLHTSLETMSYDDFVSVVANGIKNVGGTSSSVMPAYGENKTIMENVDGIYAYLKAAADGALPGGDLEKKEAEGK